VDDVGNLWMAVHNSRCSFHWGARARNFSTSNVLIRRVLWARKELSPPQWAGSLLIKNPKGTNITGRCRAHHFQNSNLYFTP